MSEKNKNILRDALIRLPGHDAPEMVWPQLEADLHLQAAIDSNIPLLPEHQPPDSVWASLDVQISSAKLSPPKLVVARMWPIWAAAASICLLFCAVWFMKSSGSEGREEMSIRYSEEKADNVLLAVVREPEDEAFQLLEEICRQPAPVCKDPEFIALKAELDELTSAKSELREAMGLYETDTELNEQLTRIERERSELLRRMMILNTNWF